MGALYIAVPSDLGMREWLEELGLPVADPADGRLPTEAEIRSALGRMDGYKVEYREESRGHVAEISWAADPSHGPWASFAFPKSFGSAGQEERLTFRKGWPEVMIFLLHFLAQSAGPQILVPDTGGTPLLVYARADPSELLQSWNADGAPTQTGEEHAETEMVTDLEGTPLHFEWCDGVWIAPMETPYGIVEVMVDGTEEEPSQMQMAALPPFLEQANELTEKTRKRLRFSFLYRPIRVAANEQGRVGLQFGNRITGAQPLLFTDE